MEASLGRDLGLVGPVNLDAGICQRDGETLECRRRDNGKRRVRLRCGREWILDPDVQLCPTSTKPASTSNGEERRLLDLLEAEQAGVERARRVLATGGRSDLYVMEPRDRAQSEGRPSYSGNGLPATTT